MIVPPLDVIAPVERRLTELSDEFVLVRVRVVLLLRVMPEVLAIAPLPLRVTAPELIVVAPV